MSSMESNRGVVKELYPELKTIQEKILKLADEQGVSVDEVVYPVEEGDTYIEFKDYDKYHASGERLFDISDAPGDTDFSDERETLEKISDTEYKVDFLYYNGDTHFGELFDEHLEAADAAYKQDGWKEAGDVKIRMHLEKWDEPETTYVYENSLKNLLQDDDGGLYGEESAQAEAADKVDDDNSRWEDWHVVKTEYKV